jgi:hypothetical protein
MIKLLLAILYYFVLYPYSVILKLCGKTIVVNEYKTKNSYWVKKYKKNDNIPDTRYTLW